jgi:hypothetical protein
MCIRCETREKARQSLAFSRVSKPHTHITYMLRQCTSIVLGWVGLGWILLGWVGFCWVLLDWVIGVYHHYQILFGYFVKGSAKPRLFPRF